MRASKLFHVASKNTARTFFVRNNAPRLIPPATFNPRFLPKTANTAPLFSRAPKEPSIRLYHNGLADLIPKRNYRTNKIPPPNQQSYVATRGASFRVKLLGFIIAAGCVYLVFHIDTVEVSGRKRIVLLGKDAEKALGKMAYEQVMEQYKDVMASPSDPRVQQVKKVAQRIIKASGINELQNLEWEFHVINVPDANAFVLPGGKVVVMSGIFPVMEDESGLATVLSHEIGHTVARHIAEENSFKFMIMAGGLLVRVLLESYGISLPFRYGDLESLVGLSHSRKCELEADHIGLLLMARACYDPERAIRLWKNMTKFYADKPVPPAFLSTHPPNETRIHKIEEWMNEAKTEGTKFCAVSGGEPKKRTDLPAAPTV
eukprot:TRINITY_DN9066_c0_g1_i1.p1 TRINITY_DN9066_c0_g1~~TRINITY_DN9066_c0_g1_i1.p1  ORF type:complete len:374 (+),score=62.94 TRINITY_DN9066_c0_g1_i1:99-1220(+)